MDNTNCNPTQFSKSRKGGGGNTVAPTDYCIPIKAQLAEKEADWLARYGSHGGVTLTPDSGFSGSGLGSGFLSGPESGSTKHAFVLCGENYEKKKGLGWFVAGLFIVADLAGGGLVALPTAMVRFGFFTGFLGTIFMTCLVCYTGYALGQNWLILQRRWPHIYATGHCRKPYPEIGLRAMGVSAMRGVSACLNITQFGVAVVYLLLSAKNIRDSLKAFLNVDVNFCIIVLIVAIALLPITFLKSPQDFWGFVVMAAVTTSLAVILILVASGLDYSTCSEVVHQPEFSVTNYFLALGTFIFSYGGHAVFPTIQHDMKKPHEFTKSAVLSFIIVGLMYTPVAVIGYLTYGDSLRDSIINSLQSVWIQQIVNLLITVHCILTLTIVFNPINQEIEEHFNVPHHFGQKRILVRTGTMCAVVFVAETMPSFGPLLDLVGGSTQTMISIILPALFYMYLKADEARTRQQEDAKTSKARLAAVTAMRNSINSFNNGRQSKDQLAADFENQEMITITDIFANLDHTTLICCTFVIVFGVIGGSAATFSAIHALSSARFVPPCYVAPFLATLAVEDPAQTVCCGHYQNVTRFAQKPTEIAGFCAKEDHSTFGSYML